MERRGLLIAIYSMAITTPYKRFTQSVSKNFVIRVHPEGSKTREWLESLEEDQWVVLGYDPKAREVLLSVDGTESDIDHTVSLTLPIFRDP